MIAIMNNELRFSKQDWSHVSSDYKDLVTKLLDRNQETRIKASEVLKHPLFNHDLPVIKNVNEFERKESNEIDGQMNERDDLENLSKLRINQKLKNADNYKKTSITTPV
jgi:serine/threonine protein kinase